jgi:hypothetical protein
MKTSRRYAILLRIITPVLLALLVLGCRQRQEIMIPAFPTVEEQFAFAQRQRDQTLPSLDRGKREDQVRVLIAGYDKVIAGFPEDGYYTPRAKVLKADLLANTDWANKNNEALELLGEVEAVSQQDDEVLAQALYLQGVIYDRIANYDAAQAKYYEVFDRFGASSDPKLRELAGKARSRYNKVRTRSESLL